ncbi:helix-turn-helix domain-containing protein [Micromonospora sp. WMMD1082]|uniref:helix-turn-helix domain-containing protein n=1 Tax=Micromonospora sp. WMMD1082 TaxID=3016104 RepID=UPI00241785C6|nr:helix-turn-helix domain-containing protein [Micromonospora sp. WMMD1082]MDG4793408.1 helix-turn-helix domain-containing protein [Micromonospora sp. WMMD1082]
MTDVDAARAKGKDELRVEAVALRATGCSVPQIAQRLGVSRSTAYLWVRHLPLERDEEEERERRRAHSKTMTDAQWGEHRRARDAARAATVEATAAWVKGLRYRELVLVGAALYWAEGTKAKPWRPHDCRVRFVNSDAALIGLFIRFVEALGERREALRYRVAIHESADVEEAVGWWAAQVGVPAEAFQPTTLKRHRPTTVRLNTGETYRGCLAVEVPRSRRLYWKIEGIMKGMSDGAATAGR